MGTSAPITGRWTVYRAGVVDVAFHYRRSDDLFTYLDRRRPRGVRGRAGSLFCTTGREEAFGWSAWALHCRNGPYDDPLDIWKLTVEGPEPRVYAVDRYDTFVSRYRAWEKGDPEGPVIEAANAYWADSVGLDTWARDSRRIRSEEPFDHRAGAEVLVDIDTVVKKVRIGGYR